MSNCILCDTCIAVDDITAWNIEAFMGQWSEASLVYIMALRRTSLLSMAQPGTTNNEIWIKIQNSSFKNSLENVVCKLVAILCRPQCVNKGFWTPTLWFMVTSWNGNIFRITGPLCGEFTGLRWIPHTKASDAELSCFFFIGALLNAWVNTRGAGDFKFYCAHYVVTVMLFPYMEAGIISVKLCIVRAN